MKISPRRTKFGYFNKSAAAPQNIFTPVTITSSGLFVLNYWTAKYNKEGIFGIPLDLKIATFRIRTNELSRMK